ncbi:DUF21 domain-containing protein [Helicobacter muridarum]|uniref:DUF21 domain-containing protein n=1 Tax=Helicobacter muridarum TaxID=216 RepID=A0A377PYL3_9HELI
MGLLIIYFLIAIIISFICSILEAVLYSITPTFIESYLKTRPKSGKILLFLKVNLDSALGAILIINLFANTVGAAGVGAEATEIFGETWQGAIAIGMTLSILYISEILPKTIGATYWKQLVLPASYIIFIFYWIVFPLVYISRIITRIFKDNKTNQMSRDEVLAIMELGEKSGSINELEGDILEHLIAQKSLSTKDIMTKKSNIFALDEEMSIKDSIKALKEEKYSRIPIYNNIPSNICSMVYRKDILQSHLKGKKKKALKSIARNITKVQENLGLLDLLDLFINKKEHLFVVLDDRNNIVGIVSLDDVIDAILNVEIKD